MGCTAGFWSILVQGHKWRALAGGLRGPERSVEAVGQGLACSLPGRHNQIGCSGDGRGGLRLWQQLVLAGPRGPRPNSSCPCTRSEQAFDTSHPQGLRPTFVFDIRLSKSPPTGPMGLKRFSNRTLLRDWGSSPMGSAGLFLPGPQPPGPSYRPNQASRCPSVAARGRGRHSCFLAPGRAPLSVSGAQRPGLAPPSAA